MSHPLPPSLAGRWHTPAAEVRPTLAGVALPRLPRAVVGNLAATLELAPSGECALTLAYDDLGGATYRGRCRPLSPRTLAFEMTAITPTSGADLNLDAATDHAAAAATPDDPWRFEAAYTTPTPSTLTLSFQYTVLTYTFHLTRLTDPTPQPQRGGSR